jgi:hypothetical protein
MEVKLNTTINEYGLYATKSYEKDSIIFTLSGEILHAPTRESIHIGNNLHVIDTNGSFLNHSFTPSCKINQLDVIALHDIAVGDELNFNYNENELEMACPFTIDNILVCGKNTHENDSSSISSDDTIDLTINTRNAHIDDENLSQDFDVDENNDVTV